jgi:hypothetical protein
MAFCSICLLHSCLSHSFFVHHRTLKNRFSTEFGEAKSGRQKTPAARAGM